MDATKKHIALVDDEEFVQVLIEGTLTPEFTVAAYSDGPSLFAGLEHQPADVILLDLEMQPMNGIEVCLHLKDNESTQDIPVIFLSGHDDLGSRLRAYEAGADDYIVKPANNDELRSKVRVVARLVEQRRALANRSTEAQKTAFAAMMSMGDMGAVMQFMRSSFACHDPQQLLGAIAEYYAACGLEGGAELRGGLGTHAQVIGEASPLTETVLNGIRGLGRIFQFKSRLAINYPQCSLLVANMPLGDDDRCGRIRDNLALVAEAAEMRLAAIDAAARLTTVGEAADVASARAASAANRFMGEAQAYRTTVAGLMDGLVLDMERAFVHLGLREIQEAELIAMVRGASQRVLAAAHGLQSCEQDFKEVVAHLAGLATHTSAGRDA